MAARSNKKLSTKEALEIILADSDSGNEAFDCGSYFEAAPDSEEDALHTEDSDLDDSLAISHEDNSNVSEEQETSLRGIL